MVNVRCIILQLCDILYYNNCYQRVVLKMNCYSYSSVEKAS